jgi:hypothetical protein
MKTTIDIADDLIKRARRVQKRNDITLRALVEEGLRTSLERHEHAAPFRFKPVVVGGDGLTPEATKLGWSKILEMANDR